MYLVVLVLKQLYSMIPATYYCEIAASSQVEIYSTSNSIVFISIVTMDKKRKYFKDYLKFGFTSLVRKNTVKP